MTRARDLAGSTPGTSGQPFAVAAGVLQGGVISSTTSYTVTLPANRFTAQPITTFGAQEGQFSIFAINFYSAVGAYYTSFNISVRLAPGDGATIPRIAWTTVQMTPGGASG
jgi:hypothetical protein